MLNTIPIRAGTDSHAWSQLAHGYFLDDAPNGDIKMYDAASTCQLNYVIVISDGMMRNHGVPEILTNPAKRGSTQAKIVELRETKSVKTLLVAYGDGINPHGMNIFDHLAFEDLVMQTPWMRLIIEQIASQQLKLKLRLN